LQCGGKFLMRSCKMPSGNEMPVFGIGTWRMGEGHAKGKIVITI